MTERPVYAAPAGFSGMTVLLAVIGGAVAGAAAAYLTAPKTGRQTRAELNDIIDTSREKIRALPGAAKVAGTAARDAFVTALREDGKA